MQSNTSTKMDNCEVKFGDLTRTVATKNVTISALGALFAIHNVQTCWPRGLSRTFLQMKMDRFSLNWKVSAYMNCADMRADMMARQTIIYVIFKAEASRQITYMCCCYRVSRNYVKTVLWRGMPLRDDFGAKWVLLCPLLS